MLNYKISDKCITILNSYKVFKTKNMKEYLQVFRTIYKDNTVLNSRTDFDLICEWKGHDIFYYFGLFRSHTKMSI